MSHFYGIATHESRKNAATCTGTKKTGLVTIAAAWTGAIKTELVHENGKDSFRVTLIEWPGGKHVREIASGPINDA